MFDFLRHRPLPIALDIGEGGVKMLQLRKTGSALTALAGGRWRLPSTDSIEAGLGVQLAHDEHNSTSHSARRELIVAAIRDMLRTHRFRGRRVVSSLPTDVLVVKNVRLPHMGDQELKQAVLWEAKERFSFAVNEDQLSYLNAGAVRQGNEVRDEIIMMAAPPQAVDEHLSMLQEVGLIPQSIDAEPLAVFRAISRFLRRSADANAVSVVVDIGLKGSRVVVARGRQIVFIKAIDIGGRKFTQAVASQLSISYGEAGELRLRAMKDSPEDAGADARESNRNSVNWTIRDAMRGEVEALAREVALCLRYCSVTFRGLRCDRVTVVGGEAYDPAIIPLLTENLGVACALGQPLRGVDTSDVDLGDRRGVLAEWAVCAGMAIRGLGEAENSNELLSEVEAQPLSA